MGCGIRDAGYFGFGAMENETEALEIDLLLDAVFKRYGHDFKSYARSHVERRLRHILAKSGHGSVSELIPRILHDEAFFKELLLGLSITVSEMFRDPLAYAGLRKEVLPVLETFPFIKIWVAGCATGEEAYSLAILLKEEHLYERATIFATDFNDSALEQAREGIYPIDDLRKFSSNYQQAGGTGSLSNYYHARYDFAVMDPSLRKNIVFANHNLARDGVFSEMHLVSCRNVLIYFADELKNRALDLFTESLVAGGFLFLGSREDIMFSAAKDRFDVIDRKARIYQKKRIRSERRN